MPAPRTRLTADLTSGFAKIRRDVGIPEEFTPEAAELARTLAAAPPHRTPEPADRRDVELLSIDPAGSRDLDQALHIERRGSGYRFHYAIADVASWVTAGDAIDVEARRRGTTIYCPDIRIPLHPTELSEGAASLLENGDRPALLWSIDLDQRGEIEEIALERATVRNHRMLSYADVQAAIDAGTSDEQFRLIEEVGKVRIEREIARGGVSLALPEQLVDRVGDHYELHYDAPLDVEGWNAQLSLCCGIAAATLMIDAKCGLLRTLPPADAMTLDRLRAHSEALGVPWPQDVPYAQWARALDPATPAGAALETQAARTLRGAGYAAFDGEVPAQHEHHALATPYAHVTAPLRRLADRFASECALAATAGARPPAWVLDALPLLPPLMAAAAHRSSQVDHAVVDLAEAAALLHLVGTTFKAVVTSSEKAFSTIQLTNPAVIGSVAGTHEIGTTVTVRLDAADLDGPTVRFSVVA